MQDSRTTYRLFLNILRLIAMITGVAILLFPLLLPFEDRAGHVFEFPQPVLLPKLGHSTIPLKATQLVKIIRQLTACHYFRPASPAVSFVGALHLLDIPQFLQSRGARSDRQN